MVQCSGCQLPIVDKYILKVLDCMWHTKCLQCYECNRQLSEKCYSRDGKLYCAKDFYRRYGTKCSGCNEGISPTDLVRRAKDMVFHVECFRCSMCLKEISTGDELYHIGGNKFVCKDDYNIQVNDTEELSESSKKEDLDCDEVTMKDEEDVGMLDDDGENGLNGKRRGPRTTIKAKQLEILKSAFSATPKPTRHMREKLAQETGLSMRVIQVWFQNRRSKERRLNNSVLNGGQVRAAKSRRTNRKTSDGQDLLEGMVNALLDPSQCSFQNQDVPEYYGNRTLYSSCEAGSYEPHQRLEDIVSTTTMMTNDNNAYNRGIIQAENRNYISQQSLHHIIQDNGYNTAYPSYNTAQSSNLHMNPVSSLW